MFPIYYTLDENHVTTSIKTFIKSASFQLRLLQNHLRNTALKTPTLVTKH